MLHCRDTARLETLASVKVKLHLTGSPSPVCKGTRTIAEAHHLSLPRDESGTSSPSCLHSPLAPASAPASFRPPVKRKEVGGHFPPKCFLLPSSWREKVAFCLLWHELSVWLGTQKRSTVPQGGEEILPPPSPKTQPRTPESGVGIWSSAGRGASARGALFSAPHLQQAQRGPQGQPGGMAPHGARRFPQTLLRGGTHGAARRPAEPGPLAVRA